MQNISPTLDFFSLDPFRLNSRVKSSLDMSDSMQPSVDQSDEQLLTAVANSRDVAAFNLLFGRFAKKIFAQGYKLSRNEQFSKDLVQEAMLQVWQKAPLFDIDRGNAQSWIFTLSRNRCFDLMRKQKRQPNTVNADDIWPVESEESSENAAETNELLQAELSSIEKYLLRLPQAQQEVLEQVYLQDKTHEEAAAYLEIPLGTLKSRLRLALGKLRQIVGSDT